jgi:hypothetical protein
MPCMLEFFRESYTKMADQRAPTTDDFNRFAPLVFDMERVGEDYARVSLLCGSCAMACTMEYATDRGSITFEGPDVCPEDLQRDEHTVVAIRGDI